MKHKFLRSSVSLLLAAAMLFGLLPIFAPEANAASTTAVLADGIYEIANERFSNYCWDYGDRDFEGNITSLYSKPRAASSQAQKWRFERSGEYYTIQNCDSGRYLEAVDKSDMSDLNGTALALRYDSVSSDAFYFKIAYNQTYGTYEITSKRYPSLYPHLSDGGNSEKTTHIHLWGGSAGQSRYFINAVVIDGVYEIASALDTDYVLDIQDNSANSEGNDGQLCLNRRDSSDNAQKWVVQRVYDSESGLQLYYSIRNLDANRYLDVDSGTQTKLHTYGQDLNANRYFCLDMNNDGTFSIRSNLYAGKYAAVDDSVGANVTVSCKTDVRNTAAGRFYLKPVTYSYTPSDKDAFNNGGIFYVKASTNPDLAFDVKDVNTNAGAKVQLYNYQEGQNYQKFSFIPTQDGHYTIRASLNDRLMTSAANVTTGTVITLESAGAATLLREKWNVVPHVDGTFAFVSCYNGLYMDAAGSVNAGSEIHHWTSHYGNNQKFNLVSVNTSYAQGVRYNGETNIYADTFDTSDTIKLPIEIYDYKADGLLFEYAETNEGAAQTLAADGSSMVTVATLTIGGTVGSSGGAVRVGTGTTPGSTGWYTYVLVDSNHVVTEVRKPYNSSLATAPVGGWWIVAHESYTAGNGAALANTQVGDIVTWTGTTDGSTITVTRGRSVTLHMGNNKGFGLLRHSDGGGDLKDGSVTYTGNLYYAEGYGQYSSNAPLVTRNIGSTYTSSTTQKATDGAFANIAQVYAGVDYSGLVSDALGYKLYNKMTGGLATIGLVEPTLGADKNPVYKQETVTYVAQLLYSVLPIPEKNSDGTKNYNFAHGEPRAAYGNVDLPQALRNVLVPNSGDQANRAKYNLGDYNTTLSKAKVLRGDWSTAKANIATCFDAAYYLLNSIFDTQGYHVDSTDFGYDVAPYDSLVLTRATTKAGKDGYVFDAGFATSANSNLATTAVEYDSTAKTIRNTSAAGKAMYYYINGLGTTYYPFLPITTQNNSDGQTKGYDFDPGIVNGGTEYNNRDYNYVLKSSGRFVYDADKDLFFDFEGDDDVYLFINGELVLDIGGAHGITKVEMSLNDYVNAAYQKIASGTNVTERDRKLALEDGKSYNFDFFYMERHGYGANMRIFTNFEVSAHGAEAKKHAYQSGELQSGSTVDTTSLVEYGFAITNTAAEDLKCFEFEDARLGVRIDYTNGLTFLSASEGKIVNEKGETLTASDLRISILDQNGDPVAIDDSLQNTPLQTILGESGIHLAAGQTILIRGIYLKDIGERMTNHCFENKLDTVCVANDGANTKITGSDTLKLYAANNPMYYQWKTQELNISGKAFVQDVLNASEDADNPLYGKVTGLTVDNFTTLTVCTAGGSQLTNSPISVTGSGQTAVVNINYNAVGAYTGFIKIAYGSSQVIVPLQTYVLDAPSNTVVLDYGLKAELGKAYAENNYFKVPGRASTFRYEGYQTKGTPGFNTTTDKNSIIFNTNTSAKVETQYGELSTTDNGASFTYTPNKFMNGADSFYTAVRVTEGTESNTKEIGALDIHKEVEMWYKTTIVPASVVYYEDDFPAIHYRRNGETVQVKDKNGSTITVKAITPDGTGSTDLSQSVDNSEQYGHDATYQSGGVAKSGNSAHIIEIVDNSVVADFTFRGTGFELIGRTNATDDTILIVEVKQPVLDENGNPEKDDDGNAKYTIFRRIPVILEYDNNADGENDTNNEGIYQVPVVRISGLEPDEYYVEIKGVPGLRGARTCFYLDGIRIYRPVAELNDENGNALEDLYLPNEKNATLEELRSMIVSNRAGVATVDTTGITIGTGTSTFTENRNSALYPYGETPTTFEGNTVGSVYDYLTVGPNNEVYLDGISLKQGIVLYFTLNEGVSLSDAELQIGLHKLDAKAINGGFEQDSDGALYQSCYENSTYKWLPVNTSISSATEQYYRIDLSACKYDADKGRYELILYADQGMISLTNVKYCGITIAKTDGTPCTFAYSQGTLVRLEENNESGEGQESKGWVKADNADAYPDFASVSEQMASRTMMLPKQDPETVITPGNPEMPDDPSETEDPTEPTETVKPTEPTETAKPTEPTETAKPTEPTETAKPTEPTETVNPTEPTETDKPTEPTETVKPTEPTETDKPTEPTETAKPTEPTETDKPTEPTEPSKPTEPTEPSKPTEPTEPTEPIDVPEFTDVKGTWYADTVNALAAKGVIKGYEDGTFRGDNSLTRAEFVTLIVRAFGFTAAKDYQSPFTDVDGWAKEYIDAAASCGIVNGIAGTIFAPDDPITREQMMTILYRVQRCCELTLPELEEVPALKDLDEVSAWAKPAVEALISTGLIRGDDHNELLPQNKTTRAEAATVLFRLLEAAERQEETEKE